MIESKGGKKRFFPMKKIKPFLKPLSYVLFATLLIFLMYYTFMAINPLKICNDGSRRGECSLIQPYYCDGKHLVERSSVCGCGNVSYGNDELCLTQYQIQSKDITLNYTLRGKEGEIKYTVYKSLIDYLEKIPISINYETDDLPLRQDFKLRKTYEPEQKALIQPLVIKIQEITSDETDQFRIAVSLIQNIPFGSSNKTEYTPTQIVYHERYPYEVLYEQQGICGEKSELLALLLKEMGYDVAIFYFKEENHEAVGVKCPIEKSLYNTGYCFIETTGPSIVTDSKITYIDGSMLKSGPEVMQISKGGMIPMDMDEYKDVETLNEINEKIINIGRLNPLELYRFKKLKSKYGLAEYYRLR